jgi:site-specific DNA-adenine methylase
MGRSLRPFFGFYGGKWRDSAKHYPAPSHPTLVEPFAGSAGYAVRHSERAVILCEADPVIASVWDYLIRVSSAEVLAIPDVPVGGCVDDLKIPPEARRLVGFWLNRGVSRPTRQPSSWMRKGAWPNCFWGEHIRTRIAGQVDAIRHWEIHNVSYERCPFAGEATWFVDPPYAEMGKHYTFGSSGIDYANLGDWCRNREGQTIVCENEGAEWLPFEPLSAVKTTRAGRRSREAVWLNH